MELENSCIGGDFWDISGTPEYERAGQSTWTGFRDNLGYGDNATSPIGQGKLRLFAGSSNPALAKVSSYKIQQNFFVSFSQNLSMYNYNAYCVQLYIQRTTVRTTIKTYAL